jgi:spore coat polysaccharide biosynthesis protein SpsF
MNIIIIQARENSTRLPDKVLFVVCGKTLLEHCYYRCSKSKADKVVIATTKNSIKIQKLCIDKKMNYFVGSEDDVLDRYYQCAKKWGATNIIRITSDCPLIDPIIINKCLDTFMISDVDYVNNSWFGYEKYPDGMDCAIITFEYLTFIINNLIPLGVYLKNDFIEKIREHVLIYPMLEKDLKEFTTDYFKKSKIISKQDLSNYRLTLDYPEDFELIKRIYEGLYYKKDDFNLDDILDFLKQNPDLMEINKKYSRNENY